MKQDSSIVGKEAGSSQTTAQGMAKRKNSHANSQHTAHLHTVVVLDDDEAEVKAIKAVLESDGYTCMTYTSPVQCIDDLRICNCDVLLCDLVMPEADGLQVLSQVREVRPGLPVIVITGHGNIAVAVMAMKRGAVDFIEKPFDAGALLESINYVVGRIEREWAVAPAEFSKMEKVVLKHILEGNGNKHIAHMIGRSVRTVEDHRSRIMGKLGASNVVDLVKRCVDMGLI